jgi:glycosyltransferase involved in cell wall biosynthesis
MRIAQVAPLYESVPPKLYGGTERVVAYLTDELIRLGHEVTLFASGDSITTAELISVWPCALRLQAALGDPSVADVLLLDAVLRRAHQFDVIHFHQGYLHFPSLDRLEVPHLTTMHGRLDLPELQPMFDRFDEVPLVSISDAQRSPLPQANWYDTVYHGLPKQLLAPQLRSRLQSKANGYFAFLGRISPEKRVDRAIEIATRLQVPLKIAAKVDRADAGYYHDEIVPLLDSPWVEFIGEIGEHQKAAFLGGARALLFPVDWPEPFGLVMIEAMACGTPVVAFNCGSVPEVIDDGVTGFVVDGMDEAVAAAARIGELDRRACRMAFEQRFSASRMARDYVAIYGGLMRRASRAGFSANVAAQ